MRGRAHRAVLGGRVHRRRGALFGEVARLPSGRPQTRGGASGRRNGLVVDFKTHFVVWPNKDRAERPFPRLEPLRGKVDRAAQEPQVRLVWSTQGSLTVCAAGAQACGMQRHRVPDCPRSTVRGCRLYVRTRSEPTRRGSPPSPMTAAGCGRASSTSRRCGALTSPAALSACYQRVGVELVARRAGRVGGSSRCSSSSGCRRATPSPVPRTLNATVSPNSTTSAATIPTTGSGSAANTNGLVPGSLTTKRRAGTARCLGTRGRHGSKAMLFDDVGALVVCRADGAEGLVRHAASRLRKRVGGSGCDGRVRRLASAVRATSSRRRTDGTTSHRGIAGRPVGPA